MMRVVAWFQIVVGVSVAGLRALLLATGGVPEVQEGRVDIWFHVAAEMVMAGLLLAASAALLKRTRRAGSVSIFALGWLGYSALNSAGYYAERAEWMFVGMFGIILTAAAIAFTVLGKQPQAEAQVTATTLGATPRSEDLDKHPAVTP